RERGGGMCGALFSNEKVDTHAQAAACDSAALNRFFHAMLERGVYLAPSAFEGGFMSSAHAHAVIARTLAAAREAFTGIAPCRSRRPKNTTPCAPTLGGRRKPHRGWSSRRARLHA